MGLFTPKRAKLTQFNTDYLNVKVVLYDALVKEWNATHDDTQRTLLRIGMDYALGEDILKVGPHAAEPAKVKSLIADGPAKADEIMANDVQHGMIIGMLAFKDKALTEYLGADWTETPEAARVRETLRSHDPAQVEELRRKIQGAALTLRHQPPRA